MKNTFKQVLAIVLTLITVMGASLSASAYAENVLINEVGSFDEETGVFTVTRNIPGLRNQRCAEWFDIRHSIKSVVIENGVTEIGDYAFYHCVYLENISFPATLESIGENVFLHAGKENPDALEIDLPGSLRSIGKSAFAGSNIKSITIPGRVTYVGQNAFGNTGIESLEILSSTAINNVAFANCKNLKTVKIPEGIWIDGTAFQGCQNVETVYYTGNEESYAAMEFLSNPNTNIICADTYYNQPATPYPVGISIGSTPDKTVYEVGEELDLTGFALALEMTDGTTRSFNDLSKMYIHNFYSSEKGSRNVCVEYYGYKTYFEYKVSEDPNGKCGDYLKWVFDDESGVLTISGYGNMYAYSSRKPAPWSAYKSFFKSINIEDGVESIGTNAFLLCDSITELSLPLSINKIDSDAFKDSEIKTIYYSGTAEDWSKISGDKNQFREMELYFNGELHEHSYVNDEIARESTCRIPGTLCHYCECGECSSESIPTLPHTPGEWETDDLGRTVKKCTECQRILEFKAEEPEELPDEETTTPDEPTEPKDEETTQPKTGENTDDSADEPAEESSVFEKIVDAFEKIAGIFEDVFGFIVGLFKF
ncbi:MAG: leucine-rich repeat protein [Clostridia bacterium]|nr:leucine-rich repeat protein [Clostridia bacterium]